MNTADLLRDVAYMLENPYSMDRKPMIEAARELGDIAEKASGYNVAAMLAIEEAIPADPIAGYSDDEQRMRDMSYRMLADFLRAAGFNRAEITGHTTLEHISMAWESGDDYDPTRPDPFDTEHDRP